MAQRKTIMSEEDRFAFDTACELIEKVLRASPEHFRSYVAPWAKRLEKECKLREKIFKLTTMGSWCLFNQSVLLEFATEQSEPFIDLCIQLCKRGLSHSPVSLVKWWKRMIACGQTSTITYFTWLTFKPGNSCVTGNDILYNCTRTRQMFDAVLVTLDSDTVLDHHLRELLGGLGSNSDIHKAWKKFCMENHPDKGGDPEKFLEVKVCYDEWCAINSNSNKG